MKEGGSRREREILRVKLGREEERARAARDFQTGQPGPKDSKPTRIDPARPSSPPSRLGSWDRACRCEVGGWGGGGRPCPPKPGICPAQRNSRAGPARWPGPLPLSMTRIGPDRPCAPRAPVGFGLRGSRPSVGQEGRERASFFYFFSRAKPCSRLQQCCMFPSATLYCRERSHVPGRSTAALSGFRAVTTPVEHSVPPAPPVPLGRRLGSRAQRAGRQRTAPSRPPGRHWLAGNGHRGRGRSIPIRPSGSFPAQSLGLVPVRRHWGTSAWPSHSLRTRLEREGPTAHR